MEFDEMKPNEIDARDLAEYIVENFAFTIESTGVKFSPEVDEEAQDYVFGEVGNKTALGYIIKDGCFEHLLEEIYTHMLYIIEEKLQKLMDGFGKDEKALRANRTFVIEVEKDGY